MTNLVCSGNVSVRLFPNVLVREHFKMKFPWRNGRELCFTLELIQTLHAQNDKENGVCFYKSVFPGEAKMCLGFMSFRAPSAALKQKNYHNSQNMLPIIIKFQVLFKFMERHLLTIVLKYLGCRHASFFAFFIF